MINMGDVWDRTVEFLGDHLGQIMPIALFAILIPTSISGALAPLGKGGAPALAMSIGVMTLGFSILLIWARLVITAFVIDAATARRASRVATTRLLPALAIMLLLLVVIAVPTLIVLQLSGADVAAMLSGQTQKMQMTPAGAGILAIYGLALLLVMLVVGARLMPLLAVVVGEKRGIGAIGHTFRLTSGLTFKLIGVILLYGVVVIVATMAANTVFGSILSLFAGGEGPVTVAGVITAVIVAAVSTGFEVLATVFAAKLYVAIQRNRDAAAARLDLPAAEVL